MDTPARQLEQRLPELVGDGWCAALSASAAAAAAAAAAPLPGLLRDLALARGEGEVAEGPLTRRRALGALRAPPRGAFAPAAAFLAEVLRSAAEDDGTLAAPALANGHAGGSNDGGDGGGDGVAELPGGGAGGTAWARQRGWPARSPSGSLEKFPRGGGGGGGGPTPRRVSAPAREGAAFASPPRVRVRLAGRGGSGGGGGPLGAAGVFGAPLGVAVSPATPGAARRPSMPTTVLRAGQLPDKTLRNLFGLLRPPGEGARGAEPQREQVAAPLTLVVSRRLRALPWELMVAPEAPVVRALAAAALAWAAERPQGPYEAAAGAGEGAEGAAAGAVNVGGGVGPWRPGGAAPRFFAAACHGSANAVRLSQWERGRAAAAAALRDLNPAGAPPEIPTPEKEASLQDGYPPQRSRNDELWEETQKLARVRGRSTTSGGKREGRIRRRSSSRSMSGSRTPSQDLAIVTELAALRPRVQMWPSHTALLPFGQASWGPFTKRQLTQINVIDISHIDNLVDFFSVIEAKLAKGPCFPIFLMSFTDLYNFSSSVLSILATRPDIAVLFVPAAFTGKVAQELVDHAQRLRGTPTHHGAGGGGGGGGAGGGGGGGGAAGALPLGGAAAGASGGGGGRGRCSPYAFLLPAVLALQRELQVPIVAFNM